MKSWLSHTLCIPRNETQRTCSIFVTLIVCFRDSTVHSFLCLYTFFSFFGCWYNNGSKDNLLCSAICCTCGALLYKSFFFFFWISCCLLVLFSIKFYWRCLLESRLCLQVTRSVGGLTSACFKGECTVACEVKRSAA